MGVTATSPRRIPRPALPRDATSLIGMALILLMLALALVGPSLAPLGPTEIDVMHRLQAPGPDHWFGTDALGRDLFARVAYGARLSISAALIVVGTTFALGVLVGGMAGLVGGATDTITMRVMDMMLSIPPLVLAVALAAALGPSIANAMIALVIVRIPSFVRLTRAQALSLSARPHVDAARLNGAGTLYLLRQHILPNAVSPLIVQAASDLGHVILASAALGFIGLGAQPPTPEWGALIADGQSYLRTQWWLVAFPGLAILMTTIGFNLLGDALRDALDPRT